MAATIVDIHTSLHGFLVLRCIRATFITYKTVLSSDLTTVFICLFVGIWQEFVEITSWQQRGKRSHRNKAVKEKATAESHVRPIVFFQTQI